MFKPNSKSIPLFTLGFSLLLGSLTASVTTEPVGYKTVTIKGNNSLNLVGIEFLNAPDYSGAPSSVGASTLTFTGADFDTLLDSGKSYFVDVISGTNEGTNTSITSWSGDTLTLGDDLSSLVTATTDTVRVHSLLTIGEVFGVGGDVLEGGSSTTADLVFFPSPIGSGLSICFYSNGGLLGQGWRIVGQGTADKSNTPIYFSDGLYIIKRSSGDADLVFSGNVKTSSSTVAVGDGFVPYSGIFPSGTTLGNSGLIDIANSGSSIQGGSTSTADLVFMDTDKDGQFEVYYYSTGGLIGTGWRRIGSGTSNMADTELTSAFGILNRHSAVAVNRSPAY